MDEHFVSKPNRRAKQDPKAHSQIVHKPMGLPEWERERSRRDRDANRAKVSKRARK